MERGTVLLKGRPRLYIFWKAEDIKETAFVPMHIAVYYNL